MLLRHPQANRELRLGESLVAYAFTRARRRSIGFRIAADGLTVRAPHWVAVRDVEDALRAKADWIVRKLQEAQQRQSLLATRALLWRDGVELPFLGQRLTVALEPALLPAGASMRQRLAGAQLRQSPAGADPTLALALAAEADPAHIRDLTRLWLMGQAQQLFARRLDHFAVLLGVRWTQLRLSNARTRWGSAKADGSIRLNWRLLHFSPAVLDYVVVHELCHLREMNHGPRFWSLVASVVPDHLALRRQLKDEHTPRWD